LRIEYNFKNIIKKAKHMSYAQQLEELILNSVIPDIDESLDAIFEEIADNKEATEDAKEEIEELREFKADLQDVLDDIKSGDIEEDECKELIDDIVEAQKHSQEEDFGFKEE
jgi:polyhydroxyalkanoate synthesis regulator phasin